MLKKTLLKIGLSSLGGMIIGIILWAKYNLWQAFLLMPLYAVGFVYGIQTVLPWIGKFLASAAKGSVLGGCFFRSFWLVLLVVILVPIGLAFLLAVAWIIGLYHVGAELIKAIKTEHPSFFHREPHNRVKHSRDETSDDTFDCDEEEDEEDETPFEF